MKASVHIDLQHVGEWEVTLDENLSIKIYLVLFLLLKLFNMCMFNVLHVIIISCTDNNESANVVEAI